MPSIVMAPWESRATPAESVLSSIIVTVTPGLSVKPEKVNTSTGPPPAVTLTPVAETPPVICPDPVSMTTLVAGLNTPRDGNACGLRKATPDCAHACGAGSSHNETIKPVKIKNRAKQPIIFHLLAYHTRKRAIGASPNPRELIPANILPEWNHAKELPRDNGQDRTCRPFRARSADAAGNGPSARQSMCSIVSSFAWRG